MNGTLTDYEKKRKLHWAVSSNMLNAFFVRLTLAPSIFVLFLSEVGLDKGRIGVLLSVMPFCGLIALFVAPWCTRKGVKRVALIFYGTRKVTIFLFLLVPWVLATFGLEATFAFVVGVLILFSVCRAIAETAALTWAQEYIPRAVRGRFSAVVNVTSGLGALLAVGIASAVLERFTGLGRYLWLMAGGAVIGIIAVAFRFPLPGGEPEGDRADGVRHIDAMVGALKDRNLRLFLGGMALHVFGLLLLTSFLPLFMKEQVGLTPARVVLLDSGVLIGGLITIGLWGWATDRFGSKPVLLTCLWVLTAMPILWTFMPRNSPLSFSVAMAGAHVFGMAHVGLSISHGTLLFNRIVPHEKRTAYMALFYAALGLVGGAAPLATGRLLEKLQPVTGDPYVPLFVLGLALLYLALHVYGRIPSGQEPSTRAFIGKFFQGNPITAALAMAGHSSVRHEHKRVAVTRRIGEIKSPLNEKEVLEALDDPSLNVRIEAVMAMARMKPSDAVVDALVNVLDKQHAELGQMAAWALGRLGDRRAVSALQSALGSRYPGIRRASARALGVLHDPDSVPLLIEMMGPRWKLSDDEPRTDAHTAACALGAIGAWEALDAIQTLLRENTQDDEMARTELALSIARLFGREHRFVSIWRRQRQEPDASLAAAAARIGKHSKQLFTRGSALSNHLDRMIEHFAAGEHSDGAALLYTLIRQWPVDSTEPHKGDVLTHCADMIDTHGAERIEYILLALALLQ